MQRIEKILHTFFATYLKNLNLCLSLTDGRCVYMYLSALICVNLQGLLNLPEQFHTDYAD